MKERKPISIKTRIFTSIFGLILLTFGTIAVILNVYVNMYIKNTTEEQLKSAISASTSPVNFIFDENGSIEEIVSATSRQKLSPNYTRTEIKSFVINSEYKVVDYKEVLNHNSINAIAQRLEEKNINLDEMKEVHITTMNGNYYISSVKTDIIGSAANDYLCFYADVTGITNFAKNINLTLFTVIGIASLVAIILSAVLSDKITKPIKKLSILASKIGKGDFEDAQVNLKLKDRELLELEYNMNQAARQLSIYDKDQKVFFQNASHELRTPLMSIRCYAEGLQYGIMEKEKAVNTIISETNRLTEMVEDLLYVSRIDNITKTYEIRNYDLREILSTCAGRLKSIADSNNIAFDFQFDETPVMFKCNDKLISRAFNNLISNAIRYANAYITLVCKKEKNKIIISIVDDGKGITEEDLPHVFERFYKGQNGNHGIGLSIVKSIIEQNNGNIIAKNSDNGAEFTIEFNT